MKIVKIGDIAKIFNGYAFKSMDYFDSVENGFQVIRITNVQNGYISNSNQKFIELNNKELQKFILNEGDILISLTGNVGRVGRIEKKNLPAVLNQRVGKVVIKSKDIFSDYLFHILKSDIIESELIERAKGIAQKNIGSFDIENIEIPLPPLEDQKRIVKILDEADALRQKRKQAIRLLDNYLKSVFLEMFGDPVKNTKEWDLIKFTDVLVMRRGFDLPKKNRVVGNYPLVASNGIVDRISKFKVNGPGIITGRSGTLGSVQLVEEDYWPLNTALYSQRLNGNNPVYLKFFLEYFDLKRFTRGAGVPTLNRNLFHSELVPNVPIEMQNKFEVIYRKNKVLKQSMFAQSSELEGQFQALMQKAFKGEL